MKEFNSSKTINNEIYKIFIKIEIKLIIINIRKRFFLKKYRPTVLEIVHEKNFFFKFTLKIW